MTPQETREMLELAAYAVGLKGCCYGSTGCGTGIHHRDGIFNPLTNKADAFDLLVKLNLNVESVYAGARCGTADKTIEMVNQDTTDHESAYMLAITRTAAAIGKQMKEAGK